MTPRSIEPTSSNRSTKLAPTNPRFDIQQLLDSTPAESVSDVIGRYIESQVRARLADASNGQQPAILDAVMAELDNVEQERDSLRIVVEIMLARYDELRGDRAPAPEFELLRSALAPRSQHARQEPGDAIAKSKRILALVDQFVSAPTANNRSSLRQALMAEFDRNVSSHQLLEIARQNELGEALSGWGAADIRRMLTEFVAALPAHALICEVPSTVPGGAQLVKDFAQDVLERCIVDEMAAWREDSSEAAALHSTKLRFKVAMNRMTPSAPARATAGQSLPQRVSSKWLQGVAQDAGFVLNAVDALVVPAPYSDATPYLRRLVKLLRTEAASPGAANEVKA